ncbi:MAG: hypothetical protein HFP81_09820 [Methylococcales symbiont of Hymedesmia sp. n. MRB-2018]|nr:MAG: hypothetical protein HFP81_09820 [Methylococcales symbiont of Hymedesmia sp. n. MRB-2018]
MVSHYFNKEKTSTFSVVFLLLILSACGNDYAEQVQKNYLQVEKNLNTLKDKLYFGELTNAKIVEIYANKLAAIKPDFRPIAKAMAKDATEKGALFQGLLRRLAKVNRNCENKQQFQQASESLMSIDIGADPIVFNDALIDLINTMAELSDGQLDTVSIPKDSQAANVRGEAITPGSYLVGNPGYGEYRQDNSGRSFWHWYGQYAFFRSMFGGGYYNTSPIYYNRWNRRPHYSYYNDYGRGSYGSSYDRRNTSQRNTSMRNNGYKPATKPKKQYGSVKGRQRVSSYNRQRSTQSNYARDKNSGGRHADKASSKRSSSFFGGKRSSSSSNTASKRSSSFFGSSSRSRSRSFGGFGGK